ncbi:hypothetical protein F0562_026797 [Nyssa sinensis]|uniref:Uncharacterized protein n=1 Tax=Nyssa sinensis TaxID=561372 RepID=A0A5J5BAA5_9ASTE|nr:hypothetical protein F0562_026797 [Nyssa sinensis]
MMGLGSLGNGGSSSSSSNLSALAPPFTVDRSNPRPNSNPLMHFTESPYAVSFNSSLHNWQYSHSSDSRPDFFSNPVTEGDYIQTTCLPSLSDYRYSGSQSIPSPSTHWPPLSPGVKNATGDFSFLQYSADVATSLVDSKPYYSPYVTPVVDDGTPLVAFNEPSNDLLCSSHVVPLEESSQVDYTQSLSGLEYTPQWGGIWSGLVDGEQGKQTEPNSSLCSKEMNVAGPYAYQNYMKQGACVAEILSKCQEDSAISKRKSIDVLQRENPSVSSSAGQLNKKSFLAQNPSSIPVESSRTSVLGSTSVISESHLQGPSLGSTTNSWNLQTTYNPSYEKCFQPLDYCMNDVLGRENHGVFSSTGQLNDKSFLAQNPSSTPVESSRTSVLGSTSILSESHLQVPSLESTTNSWNHQKPYNPLYEKCFQPLDFGMTDHISITKSSPALVIRPPVIDTASSAPNTVPSETVNFIDNIVAVNSKEFNGHNPSKIKAPYCANGFTLAVDGAKAVSSVENFSESLDHYNPAVDSPCWKGAPTSHFSPFDVSKVVQLRSILCRQLKHPIDFMFKGLRFSLPILMILQRTQAAVADVEVNNNDASEAGCVPSKAMKNVFKSQ